MVVVVFASDFGTLILLTRAVWVGFFDKRVCCLLFEALDVCFLVVACEEFEADLHTGLVWGTWLDLVGLMCSFRLPGFVCMASSAGVRRKNSVTKRGRYGSDDLLGWCSCLDGPG